MSFVTVLRDYVDCINNISDSVTGDLNFFQLSQHTLSYLFQTLLYVFSYVFTLQWLRDLSNLPVIVPQISLSVLKENLVLENPSSGIFAFFQTSFFDKFETNKFVLGFLNSFFLSLPLSCSNLIIFRRLLVQGVPAGISAALGSVFGHFLFIATILFGIRLFFISWLSFDSIQYLFGLVLLLASVFSMACEAPPFRRIPQSSTGVLLKMFALNFGLAWTEQSCVFQYVGNLTFSGEPTILETLSARNQIDSFLIHISYLSGILVGSLFFCFFFCFLAHRFISFLQLRTGVLESTRKINFILLTTIISFSLASIPFYGLDYLITKPLGFVSQDKALEKSLFYRSSIPKPLLDPLTQEKQFNEPEVDISPLNRTRYLESHLANNTFEDLNYQGEYAWKIKDDKRKMMGKDGSNDFLLKLLKKAQPKSDIEKQDIELKEDRRDTVNTPNWMFESEANNLFFHADQNFLKYERAPSENPRLEKEIKQKYYSNPVYKKLLSADIDFFLLRQPSSYSLTSSEEKNLFNKRLILADYYDSLRFYNDLPYAQDFQKMFQGSKSYADRVYNQQFKGTFNIVRRLFSITASDIESKTSSGLTELVLADDTNEENTRVLKYDQPLYTNHAKKNQPHPFFHEEAPIAKIDGKPFFEPTQVKPFYAGWDNDERRFIITNRFLPRSIAGYGKLANENSIQPTIGASASQSDLRPDFNFVEFSAWPLSSKFFENGGENFNQNIPYTFLFQLQNQNVFGVQKQLNSIRAENSIGQPMLDQLTSLPTNIILNESGFPATGLFDRVAPKRGGFVWPGKHELKIDLSQLKK